MFIIHIHLIYQFAKLQYRFYFANLCTKLDKIPNSPHVMSWNNVRNISNSCRVRSEILICFTRKTEHVTSSVSSLHTGHNKSLRIIAFLHLHLCTVFGDIPNLNLSFRKTELQNVYILLCLDTLFENRIKFKAFFLSDRLLDKTFSPVLLELIQQSLFQNRYKSVQMSYILL